MVEEGETDKHITLCCQTYTDTLRTPHRMHFKPFAPQTNNNSSCSTQGIPQKQRTRADSTLFRQLTRIIALYLQLCILYLIVFSLPLYIFTLFTQSSISVFPPQFLFTEGSGSFETYSTSLFSCYNLLLSCHLLWAF